MSELTGPGVSTCERHKSRASRQKSGRRRPMRRQSGFLAGNGERGPNLTAIFHPPVFPHGLLDFCTMLKGCFGSEAEIQTETLPQSTAKAIAAAPERPASGNAM